MPTDRELDINSSARVGPRERTAEAEMEGRFARRQIWVTEDDFERLQRLLASKGRLDGPDKQGLRDLQSELQHAVVVSSSEIPAKVVTMNSRFRLTDLDTGDVAEYTLVFPGEANIQKGRLSIIAPIGTALLGCSERDTIEWKVPVGTKRFRLDQVLYQPEAAESVG